ncbi:unnamed protein product [Prorocentrum cordatum]|uniref:C3H1-type domain-containing protein n=1 Tax=Prorocentrum cordatum TaxID=2364126 RepID=A0ABN9VRS4_9DINO|nr:unnamed protein product [Polarella glacialis]
MVFAVLAGASAVLSRAVDSVKALNWLHGGRQPPSFSSPALSQATALQHLLDFHRTDVPEIVNAEAARVELLGAGQDYADGPELPIASYDKDLLSMPQLGAEPVDVSTVLEGRARECLVNFEEEILHGPDDWGHITECEEHVKPYMDPVLKTDADAYFGFVMRGHRSGLFRFGRTSHVIVTPFFAKKKSGTLRLILDCRPSNRRMRESPYVRLGGPADVARLLHSRGDGDPCVALGDVCDFFRLVFTMSKAFPFFQVPKENLVGPTWTKVVRSFWNDEEPIFCLEARAGLLAVRHKLRAVSSFGKTHLHLGDSMTAILAFEKGRAKHRGLLGACRRLLALSVASNTRHHFRWVPSELNPSDPDSRYFELPVDSDGRRLLRRSTSRAWTVQADPLDTVLAEKTRRSARRLVLKRQRALKRARAIGGVIPALKALRGERAVLESSHPSTPVRRGYCRRLDKFWEFGRSQGLSLANLKVCDDALCDFAELLFLDGEQVDAGTKLLAALEDHDVQRFGKPGLPRFRRVLRAWNRKGPVGSRDPLPFRLLAGILGVLSLHGFHEEVLALALMFCCYLRPSELLTVVEGDLLEPVANAGVALACWSLLLRPFEREEPTKVGQFDDTLPLDSPDFPGLGALLAGLRGGGAEVWLFSFSQTQLLRRFQAACRAAGLGSLNLEMHQLRRGGASRDFLMKTREIQAVKQRGRWANDRTLLRYMKAGRVQRLHKALTPEASRWCQEAQANLSSLPRSLGGGFVIEVFSGSGRLAKSFAELGIPALTWDIEHGPAGDLLDDDVLRCVLSYIASVRAVPCLQSCDAAQRRWTRWLALRVTLPCSFHSTMGMFLMLLFVHFKLFVAVARHVSAEGVSRDFASGMASSGDYTDGARQRLGAAVSGEGREKVMWKATFIEVGDDLRQGSLSPRPCSEPCFESSSYRSAFFDADRMHAAALSKHMEEAWASNSRETMRKLLSADPSIDFSGEAHDKEECYRYVQIDGKTCSGSIASDLGSLSDMNSSDLASALEASPTEQPHCGFATAPAMDRLRGAMSRKGREKVMWKATFIEVDDDQRQGSLSPRPSSEPCTGSSSCHSAFFDADRMHVAALSKHMEEAWASNSLETMRKSIEERRLSAAANVTSSLAEQLSLPEDAGFSRWALKDATCQVVETLPEMYSETMRALRSTIHENMKQSVAHVDDHNEVPVTNHLVADMLLQAKTGTLPHMDGASVYQSSHCVAGIMECVKDDGFDSAFVNLRDQWPTSLAASAGGANYNPGSRGHPEMCVRPCLYFLRGQCTNGDGCRFCHCPHPTRPVHLGRSHRKTLAAATTSECFDIMLPILERKMITLGLPTGTLQLLAGQHCVDSGSRVKPRGLRTLEKVFAVLSMRMLLVVLERKVGAQNSRDKTLLDALIVEVREAGFLVDIGEDKVQEDD